MAEFDICMMPEEVDLLRERGQVGEHVGREPVSAVHVHHGRQEIRRRVRGGKGGEFRDLGDGEFQPVHTLRPRAVSNAWTIELSDTTSAGERPSVITSDESRRSAKFPAVPALFPACLKTFEAEKTPVATVAAPSATPFRKNCCDREPDV